MLYRITHKNDYLFVIDYLTPSIGDWVYNEHWGHSQITDNATLYGKGYQKGAFKIIAHLPMNNVKKLDGVPLLPFPTLNGQSHSIKNIIEFYSENEWDGDYIFKDEEHLFKKRFIVVEMCQLDTELEKVLGNGYIKLDKDMVKNTIDDILCPINLSQIILDSIIEDDSWSCCDKKIYKTIINEYLIPNGFTEINGDTYGDEDYICIDYKNKEWCWCENGCYPFCYKDNMEKYQHLPSITLADLVKRIS